MINLLAQVPKVTPRRSLKPLLLAGKARNITVSLRELPPTLPNVVMGRALNKRSNLARGTAPESVHQDELSETRMRDSHT
jgi:hypothetical protein